MPPSESTFLMGWDIATGQAHMFEIADTAEVHDHSGKWIDGKSVSLVRQGKTLDGKLEKDACKATWVSPSEVKLDCTGTQGGVHGLDVHLHQQEVAGAAGLGRGAGDVPAGGPRSASPRLSAREIGRARGSGPDPRL